MQNELIVRNSTEMFRFSATEMAAILADGNYCKVLLTDGSDELLPFQLGHLEDLCGKQLGAYSRNFIRIGRSVMLNAEYIFNINIPERKIVLRTPQGKKIRLDHLPPEALKALKLYMEEKINQTNEHGSEQANEKAG